MQNHHLESWNIRSGELTSSVLINNPESGNWISLNTNGVLQVACANPTRKLFVWDLQLGKQILSFAEEPSTIIRNDWSHDGTMLATSSIDGKVSIWRIPVIRSQLAELGLDWDHP